jgi:hypothetical protein
LKKALSLAVADLATSYALNGTGTPMTASILLSIAKMQEVQSFSTKIHASNSVVVVVLTLLLQQF